MLACQLLQDAICTAETVGVLTFFRVSQKTDATHVMSVVNNLQLVWQNVMCEKNIMSQRLRLSANTRHVMTRNNSSVLLTELDSELLC